MLININRRFKNILRNKAVLAAALIFFLVLEFTDIIIPNEICIENVNDSCFFEEGGILAYADNGFLPDHNSIYFHETSCKGGLNSRQACAVESAARSNPHLQVYVLILSPVKKINQSSISALRNIQNVNLYRINLLKYAEGTPLEKLLANGALKKTDYKMSHASDFLRFITLYKWGGIYLDLDTVVMKNLSYLGNNWAARENNHFVAAGALAFSWDVTGRTLAEICVQNIAHDYRGDEWAYNGPGVITRALKEMCHTKNVKEMNGHNCNGFNVYGPEIMYPVNSMEAISYFIPFHKKFPRAFSHHVWNKLTHDKIVEKNSFYVDLAKKYCPTVYNTYGDNFGN